MKNNVLDIIADYAVNEGMNGILLKDGEYIEIQQKIDERIIEFDSLGLTKEQRLAADRLVSAHMEYGAYYGKMAYKKVFWDCVCLLQELGLIKAAS